TRTSVERKRRSGVRSASKKSGASRWETRLGSCTFTFSAFASPVRLATPSATERVAATGEKLPRNVPTMYLTAKPTWEWTGSSCHVPAGRTAAFVDSMVLMRETSVGKLDYARNPSRET